MTQREKLLDAAGKWLGCNEKDGTHKPIIDLYNSHKPLARNYKIPYTGAWCATFVSACAIAAGLTDIIPTEVSCGKQIALFKKLGSWVENDAYSPTPGDIIYYDWDDDGKGDASGWPDHVGIVQSNNGTTIKVIEGNYKDAVGIRSIRVNDRYIRGYGVPKYSTVKAYVVDTKKDPLNIRTKADGDILAAAGKGAILLGREVVDGWVHVAHFDGQKLVEGWAAEKYLLPLGNAHAD